MFIKFSSNVSQVSNIERFCDILNVGHFSEEIINFIKSNQLILDEAVEEFGNEFFNFWIKRQTSGEESSMFRETLEKKLANKKGVTTLDDTELTQLYLVLDTVRGIKI